MLDLKDNTINSDWETRQPKEDDKLTSVTIRYVPGFDLFNDQHCAALIGRMVRRGLDAHTLETEKRWQHFVDDMPNYGVSGSSYLSTAI